MLAQIWIAMGHGRTGMFPITEKEMSFGNIVIVCIGSRQMATYGAARHDEYFTKNDDISVSVLWVFCRTLIDGLVQDYSNSIANALELL